jgi:hypothetical protein
MWLAICNEDNIRWSFDERRPQNIKSGICQQPLIGSSSNFILCSADQTKIKIGLKYEMKMTSNGSFMEDNLKIFKVEYHSNQLSDLPQIQIYPQQTKPK